jgi:hypothetical protein
MTEAMTPYDEMQIDYATEVGNYDSPHESFFRPGMYDHSQYTDPRNRDNYSDDDVSMMGSTSSSRRAPRRQSSSGASQRDDGGDGGMGFFGDMNLNRDRPADEDMMGGPAPPAPPPGPMHDIPYDAPVQNPLFNPAPMDPEATFYGPAPSFNDPRGTPSWQSAGPPPPGSGYQEPKYANVYMPSETADSSYFNERMQEAREKYGATDSDFKSAVQEVRRMYGSIQDEQTLLEAALGLLQNRYMRNLRTAGRL